MSTESHKKRIIFVDLKQFHSCSNVKINFHLPKKEKSVLNVKETRVEKYGYANYFSIIRNPENNITLTPFFFAYFMTSRIFFEFPETEKHTKTSFFFI